MRPNWSAFHRVREYGPRSVLAAAGVAVGVALTITMSSLVDSVELAATAGLRTIGSDLYYVHPRSMAEFGTTGRPLSLADVTALQRGTSVLEQVSPVVTVQVVESVAASCPSVFRPSARRTRSDAPVISAGLSMPRRSRTVGAMSASRPFSRRATSAGPLTSTVGTTPTVCCVCG